MNVAARIFNCCPHPLPWLCQSHAQLCGAVSQLAAEVQADEALSARIMHKFKIKNTVSCCTAIRQSCRQPCKLSLYSSWLAAAQERCQMDSHLCAVPQAY